MTITAEDLVNREVLACVSHLVATLAADWAGDGKSWNDLGNLIEQACELARPVDDWEEAATQAGWKPNPNRHGGGWWWKDNLGEVSAPSAQDACESEDIEPYQREVYEHWAVSDWLADKLEAHGEKVDKDFAYLCVWARTTTGQAIAMDSVIQAIYAELTATT